MSWSIWWAVRYTADNTKLQFTLNASAEQSNRSLIKCEFSAVMVTKNNFLLSKSWK